MWRKKGVSEFETIKTWFYPLIVNKVVRINKRTRPANSQAFSLDRDGLEANVSATSKCFDFF